MNLSIPTDGKTVTVTSQDGNTVITISDAGASNIPPANNVLHLATSVEQDNQPSETAGPAITKKLERLASGRTTAVYAVLFLTVLGGGWLWSSHGSSASQPTLQQTPNRFPIQKMPRAMAEPSAPVNPSSPNAAFGLE